MWLRGCPCLSFGHRGQEAHIFLLGEVIFVLSRLLARPGFRNLLLGTALAGCIVTLLLYPSQAMEAAKTGLLLCFNVIIPSLFPFFVLSTLAVELGLVSCLGRLLAPLMRPLFRVPGEGAAALVLGFVGGYPVGARTTLSLYERGLCSRTEAERMLAFCNNSGPAFIFGVVGIGIFSSSKAGLLLYLAHCTASLCVGLLFRFYKGKERPGAGRLSSPRFEAPRLSSALIRSIQDAFSSTLNICAFVVFFTVVIRLLTLTGVFPTLAALITPAGMDPLWGERLLTGLVELSSGVGSLAAPGSSGRLELAAFMLGWAGLSVHCQVLSFLGDSGLSVKPYFAGKLLHGCLSALLIAGLQRLFPLHLQASAALIQQVEDLTRLDFATALTISTAIAWLVWLLFFGLALFAAWKNSGKRRRKVLEWRKP